MNELQSLAVRAALSRMIAQGWLSICTVDEILKATGGVPDRTDYQTLKLLHCVSFKDMEPALRAQLPALLERVLGAAPVFGDGFVPLAAPDPVAAGGMLTRLLSRVSK